MPTTKDSFRAPIQSKGSTPKLAAALLLAAAWLPPGLADDHIEEVVVSIPTLPTVNATARAVNKLDGELLRQQAAMTLGETLAQQPGISNANYGPGVGQPVIRGQQGPRVTLLRNSTSVADASNISVDHAIVAEPVQARTIEVLRGPSTLLFGGGAIGGIVNVIDQRVPRSNELESGVTAELRHGSVNDQDTAVINARKISENYGFTIDGLYRDANEAEIPGEAVEGDARTEGRLLNSRARANNIAVGGSKFFDSGFVGLSYESTENLYGIPPSDEQLDEGELINLDIEQERYELMGENRFSESSLEAVRWFITYSDYEHTEVVDGESGTVFSNENLESRVELSHRHNADWSGAAGMQLRSRNFAAIGDEAFVPAVDITSLGLFLIEQTRVGNATIELGARYDYDQVETDAAVNGILGADEEFNSVNLSASSLWDLNDHWSTGVALSYAERGLVVEELYSNPSCDANLDNLVVHEATEAIEIGIACDTEAEKETSQNIEATLRHSSKNNESKLILFYNDFADYAYLRNTGASNTDGVQAFQYTQADAEFYGLEIESTWLLADTTNGKHELTLWGDMIRGELSGTNEDLPRLPSDRIGARWSGQFGSFGAFSTLTHATRQDKPGIGEAITDSYTRWDAGVEYLLEQNNAEYLGFLRVKNITDEEIRYSTSFRRAIAPETGRSVEVGVRIDI